MPLTSIIILTAIVSAFATFAAALAWGDYCTRDLVRGPRLKDPEVPRTQTTESTSMNVTAEAS